MPEIKVEAFSIERTTIKTDDTEYGVAKLDGELGNVYDAHLSDMDGTTVIIDPESGQAFDPYMESDVDLIALLRPILAHVPTWVVEQYVAGRRAEEE